MRVATAFQNFSRGKMDHNMMGRYDLPIYSNGADVFKNFISNFQGNAKYRPGFEEMLTAQDGALAEFKFNNTQDYVLFFYANTIQFAAYDGSGNFGWVLVGAGPTIFTVATPYTLAECKQIQVTQNADVMIITHPNHPPYALTRTSATTFTMFPQSRKDDPFPLTFAGTKTISGITQATQAVLTIVGHGYSVNDQFQVAAVVGMVEINTYVATVVAVPDADNVTVNIDSTKFTAYTSGGTAAKVLTGDYPQCCCFYKGRLFYANSPLNVTTIWASQSGAYDKFLVPTTPVDTDALKFPLSDITQPITWLFPGDNSLIVGSADGIEAINGGDVNTAITPSSITATLSTAPGSNYTVPIGKDGFCFYIGTNGRNVYYFSYDFLSARFQGQDANFLSYDITKGGMNKLRWKKDRDDLVYCVRNDGELLTLNFQQQEKINGWHEQTTTGTFQDIALMTDSLGNPQIFALCKRNGSYYLERQRQFVEFVELSGFYSGDDAASQAADRAAYIRYVAEQLNQCNFMDSANQLSGLQSNALTFTATSFNPDGSPAAGNIISTSNVFSSGSVGHHISYQTQTGYESGRFLITGYTNATHVAVNVLQTPTANTYTNWYLTFNTISGLSRFNGQQIGVVGDGGYLGLFTVSSGTIALGREIGNAWVGYVYRGLIKSFSLGFSIQGKNTQMTFKNIAQFSMRFASSAGMKVGTSQYSEFLESVQTLTQEDLNYLPPIPMDGTIQIPFVDQPEFDKFFYAVQDQPLPANICAAMIDANYV